MVEFHARRQQLLQFCSRAHFPFSFWCTVSSKRPKVGLKPPVQASTVISPLCRHQLSFYGEYGQRQLEDSHTQQPSLSLTVCLCLCLTVSVFV